MHQTTFLWMAKLRRDMFPWYYEDQIEIFDYDKAGQDKVEDQDEFDAIWA